MARGSDVLARIREKQPLAFVSFCLAWPLLTLFSHLPVPWAAAMGKWCGAAAFYGSRKHRDVSLRNLRAAFPEKRPAQRWDIARRSFENVGRTFVEFPGLLRRNRESVLDSVRFAGWENVTRASEEKRAILFLTGHIGNWELMALAQGFHAPPPLAFIARPLDNPYMERWVSRIRTRSGNRIIGKSGALRQVVRYLRQGYAVGMLMDQSTTGKDGLFVDFFDHLAGSSAAIGFLALRYGACIIPAYAVRDVSGVTYTVHTDPPVNFARTGHRARDLYVATQRCQKVLEDVIRRYPDQWFWMHRRWKWSPTVLYKGKGSDYALRVLAFGRIGGIIERGTGLPRVKEVMAIDEEQ